MVQSLGERPFVDVVAKTHTNREALVLICNYLDGIHGC